MPRLRLALLAAVVSLGGLPGAARADASATCAYDGRTHTLSVTSSEDVAVLIVDRSGSSIVLDTVIHDPVRPARARLVCTGPQATVTNTDAIAIGGGTRQLWIELGDGPLAPGYTAEGDGSSEIEVSADAAVRGIWLWGSSGRERIRAGTSAGVPRLNLNAGESAGDADVVAPGLKALQVSAFAGDDTVDGRGGAGTGDPLKPEYFAVHGHGGNDVIAAPATTIEAYLAGEEGDDVLTAAAGDDWVAPGDGDDRVAGLQAGGRDRLLWAPEPPGGIRFDLAVTGPQDTGQGIDTIGAGVEQVWPTAGPDVIRGTAGDESLFGYRGDDVLDGRGGRDELDGGEGADTLIPGDGREGGSDGAADTVQGGPGLGDTVSYAGRTSAVAIRLDGIRNDGADPDRDGVSSSTEEGDLVRGIENATGGAGPDRIRGFASIPARFLGGPGNDWLHAGTGADVLDGQAGNDTVSYAYRSGGVAVRLDGLRNDGTDTDGDGVSEPGEEHDLVLGMENAAGGSGADTLIAPGAEVNVLTGGGGADLLDAFDGTTAVDRLVCGPGTDRYRADAGDVRESCEAVAP